MGADFPIMKTVVYLLAILILGCILGCESQRDERIRFYNAQLAQPASTLRFYEAEYAASNALCKPKAAWYSREKLECDQAKAAAARIELARKQAAVIYAQMADDELLSDHDRQDAKRVLASLN